MIPFNYYTPTEVVFGKESLSQVGELIKKYKGTKVLVHYGGKSAVKSGLIDSVCSCLKGEGIDFVLLPGVVPNPRVALVRTGIELCRKEGVDFILAVGGGSVIDSSKAISIGVPYEDDVWDFYLRKVVAKGALPVATILTIPAAGSEMSNSSVITNDEGQLKRSYNDNILRPKFSILNPELTYTLPPYQTACGATDIMMHTMERFFSHEDDMTLTDNIAESILRTVKEEVFNALANPTDYHSRAQIMWAGSLAHNDLTGCGTEGDWSTHDIEHELSGMFDVAHGAGLATVWGSWARYVYKLRPSRFARFAVNVLGVPNDFTSVENTALRGIEAMERFFHAIGMPISIPELIGRKATEEEIQIMAKTCTDNDTHTVGVFKRLTSSDIAQIYRCANK